MVASTVKCDKRSGVGHVKCGSPQTTTTFTMVSCSVNSGTRLEDSHVKYGLPHMTTSFTVVNYSVIGGIVVAPVNNT